MTIACMQARRKVPQALGHDVHSSEIDRQNPGRMGTSEVPGCVADHPYRVVRRNSRAVEREVDRLGRRLVAQGILGANRAGYPTIPAEMLHLGPQIVAD